MAKSWRPEKGWKNPIPNFIDDIAYDAYEIGADAMHEADVEWLIERITHDDRGYVLRMSDKEWQSFIDD